jgi:hypothetical protein
MRLPSSSAPSPGCPRPVIYAKGVFTVKRFVTATVAITALLLPGSALAKTKREVGTSPVNFTLTSDTCSNLPPGTTINGTGTMTSITWTTKRHGLTTVTNSSLAPGTATDQAGNQYTFLYSNQFHVSNTRARRKVYSGPMIDVFTLQGAGPVKLSNDFLARFTTDFKKRQSYRPIKSFGDPIDFKTAQAHCDPL